jgi:hypothetical protein
MTKWSGHRQISVLADLENGFATSRIGRFLVRDTGELLFLSGYVQIVGINTVLVVVTS